MTRRGWFFATYFAVLGVGASMVVHPAPRLIWNETASVPVGLYRLHPVPAPHVGDLVAVRLPEREAMLLARRGYLPSGVPLLKPVAAVAGSPCAVRDNASPSTGNSLATRNPSITVAVRSPSGRAAIVSIPARFLS